MAGSPLSRMIARTVEREGYLLEHPSDREAAAEVARRLAERVVDEMALSGLAVETFGYQGGYRARLAMELMQSCALMDRVGLYAQRLGPAPVVPGLHTAAGEQVWLSESGPEVAAAFLASMTREYLGVDPRIARQQLCAGELDAIRDLQIAERAVELQVRELACAIDEAGAGAPWQEAPKVHDQATREFLERFELMDRVRDYGQGVGSCPDLEGLTVQAHLLWDGDEGRRIARAFIKTASSSLEQLGDYRLPSRMQAPNYPAAVKIAGSFLARWVKRLTEEVNEAARRSPSS